MKFTGVFLAMVLVPSTLVLTTLLGADLQPVQAFSRYLFCTLQSELSQTR